MTKSRILIKVAKESVRLISDKNKVRAGYKIVAIPNANPTENSVFKQEGTGAEFTNPDNENLHSMMSSRYGTNAFNKAEDNWLMTGLNGFLIELKEELAERLNRYIHFKEKVKEAGGAFGDAFIDLRDLNYDGTVDGSDANCFVHDSEIADGAEFQLLIGRNDNNWGGKTLNDQTEWEATFQFFNVDNDKAFVDGYRPVDKNPYDFKFELDAFWETEALLKRLDNSYNKTMSFANVVSQIRKDIEELELYEGGLGSGKYTNTDNTSVTLKSGGPATSIKDILGLDPTADATNANKRKELAKKALYDTTISDAANSNVPYYKTKVDTWLRRLKEIEIWNKVVGLTSVDEIVKFNAAGFTISVDRIAAPGSIATDATKIWDINTQNQESSAGNTTVKDFFPNPDRTYSGFKILEDTNNIEVVDAAGSTDGGTTFFEKKGQAKALTTIKYTKDNIDALRAIKNTTDADDSNSDQKHKDLFKNFADKTDPKDLWGFEPGDINGNNATIDGKNYDVTKWDNMLTKREAKIRAAVGKNAVTNEAFLDTYFQEVNLPSNCIPKVDLSKTNYKSAIKLGDNCTKATDILDRYWANIRFKTSVWQADGSDLAKPNSDNPDSVKLLEEYNEMKDLVRILVDEKYTSTSDKTQAQKDKAILEKYKNTTANSVQDRLKSAKILEKRDAKLKEINEKALGVEGFSKDADLSKAIEDNKNNAEIKKIYEEFKKLSDSTTPKKTNSLFDSLKALVAELQKTEERDTPKAWKETWTAAGAKKEAWDFVDLHTKEVDKYKPNGWATKVVDEAIAKLTSTINAAKAEIKKESDTAVTKTEIENQPSIKTAKEIGDLFKLCKEAHGAVSADRAVKLKSDLESYKNATEGPKKAAWEQVNKYEKNAGKKYADEALEIVTKKNQDDINNWNAMMKGKDPKEVREIGKSKKVEEIEIKRAQAAKLFETSTDDKEKELHDIFNRESLSDYSESDDKLEDSIKDIEKHIEELKKYIDNTDVNSPEGKIKAKMKEMDGFGEANDFLNEWKTKLEDRKATLVSKRDANKQQGRNPANNQEDGGFWGGWMGKVTIGLGVAAALGLIAWLIKANSSEEGEGENE